MRDLPRRNRPDHTAQSATRALRARLCAREQGRILQAQAEGDHATAERLTWEWLHPAAAASERAAQAAREGAAELGRVALSERIGRAPSRLT